MDLKNIKIAIIGCGNLGQSIINGLLEDQVVSPTNIIATRRNTVHLEPLTKLGISITNNNTQAIQESELIILALKPYNILDVISELSTRFNPEKHVIVSLATGISLEQIQNKIQSKTPVFRAMPNTASAVGKAITCICSSLSNSENSKLVESCFNSIGATIFINESLMDSATVLGACGIAYVLRFIRGMVQGGIQIGFDAKTANEIVTHAVKGASQLLIKDGNHPEFEIDKVTTPRGCTIAGLNEMEHHGFSSALIKGIVASYKKIEK